MRVSACKQNEVPQIDMPEGQMVTMMIKTKTLCADIARALRNFRYERTADGLYFAGPKFALGGVFATSVDGGEFVDSKNTACLEGLDAMLSAWFNSGSNPTAFYLAPFTNNVTPSSALTAATFTATQGEYTGYTETTRQLWTPNGDSVSQSMSNSNAPAAFTIGASAATIAGGALIATAGAKSAITGKIVASALFASANTLGAGSTLKIKYSFGAVPA